MCTAVSFHGDSNYFGRTLDHHRSYGENVVFTPRYFPLPFRQVRDLDCHHAILGMAHVTDGYPLYYDAMNEHGLCMAGLNFEGFARYGGKARDRVASFELIPWLLGQCASVAEARPMLEQLCITPEAFSPELPPAPLHWLLADKEEALTIEAMEGRLQVWENPVGVLTNAPPFDDQLRRLADHMHLTPMPPHNLLAEGIDLKPYTLGMGAMGMPGDLSSQSRFVRAAFTRLHAVPGGPGQFFRILDTVVQVEGCCRTVDGGLEHTLYASCCDTQNRVYYYTTECNRRICGIAMDREKLDGKALIRWQLLAEEDILLQN